jgi:hypothetical protein
MQEAVAAVFILADLVVVPAAAEVVEQAVFLVPLETPERQTLEAVLVEQEEMRSRGPMEVLAL